MTRLRALLIPLVLLGLLLGGAETLTGRAQTVDAGQIAIAAQDGNIYLYDIATDETTPLTDDAVSGSKAYSWPTWSNDGRLAFFGSSRVPDDQYQFGIFIRNVAGAIERIYTSSDEFFTYASWAPADCPAGNCRDLAVLYTAASGNLALRRVRVDGEVMIEELSEGGPHYWDWSPDGSSMLWARFGTELSIYDADSNAISETFTDRLGFQRAVDWSPTDNRMLAAVRAPGRLNDLMIFEDGERLVLAEGFPGPVSFEWSPDGTKVAYLDEQRARLTVADARTGEAIATAPDDAYAFFWAPDSTRLAYLTITQIQDSGDVLASYQGQRTVPRLQWVVFSPESGNSARLAAFLPTRETIYYLRFFDQFARSHRLWSPDSRYLTYGEVLADGRSVVSLLDTTAPSTVRTLMEGQIGVFSW